MDCEQGEREAHGGAARQDLEHLRILQHVSHVGVCVDHRAHSRVGIDRHFHHSRIGHDALHHLLHLRVVLHHAGVNVTEIHQPSD